MNREFDFKSIRIIAFVFPALIFTMGLLYGIIYLLLDADMNTLNFTIFLNLSSATYPVYILNYLLSIALFVSLFRLSELDPHWNAAMILMMISLILETGMRIFEWQTFWLEFSVLNAIIVAFIGVAPQAFSVAAMICFLSGIRRIRRNMTPEGNRARLEKENTDRQRVFQLWISAALILIISIPIFVMLYLFTTNSVMLLLKWVGLAEAAAYLFVSVMVTRIVWSFCQEFYLYQYNHGSIRGM